MPLVYALSVSPALTGRVREHADIARCVCRRQNCTMCPPSPCTSSQTTGGHSVLDAVAVSAHVEIASAHGIDVMQQKHVHVHMRLCD